MVASGEGSGNYSGVSDDNPLPYSAWCPGQHGGPRVRELLLSRKQTLEFRKDCHLWTSNTKYFDYNTVNYFL